MPFVKVSALRSARDNWRDALHGEGYDPGLAEGAVRSRTAQTRGELP
jgi:hypothetical protein